MESRGPVTDKSPAVAQLAGTRVAILNWRDEKHPQAGGAELYAHRNAEYLADNGVDVSFLTSRPAGLPATSLERGVRIERRGGTYSVYPRTLARLLHSGFDAIIDAQNGIPFLAPLVTRTPVLPLIHHIHQEQLEILPAPLALIGKTLEGKIGPHVYHYRPVACVSRSTALGARDLGYRGPLLLTPPGVEIQDPRAPKSSNHVVSVNRFVDHKRVDLAIAAWRIVLKSRPGLVLDLVGAGPLFDTIRADAHDLVAAGSVVFHGSVDEQQRNYLVSRSQLALSASHHEGWGVVALEAAGCGVPMVCFEVEGLRDSVLPGRTGWFAAQNDDPASLAATILSSLDTLSNPEKRREIEAHCRQRANDFSWEHSGESLAKALLVAMKRQPASSGDLAL